MTAPLRIAIADDEPVVREYLCTMLPLLGHKVVAVAQNGQELVEGCRAGHPDLIIADVRMPDMDGDEAICKICRDRPTPFILISAYSKPSCDLAGIDGVAWAQLTKPITRDDLELVIQQLFCRN